MRRGVDGTEVGGFNEPVADQRNGALLRVQNVSKRVIWIVAD